MYTEIEPKYVTNSVRFCAQPVLKINLEVEVTFVTVICLKINLEVEVTFVAVICFKINLEVTVICLKINLEVELAFVTVICSTKSRHCLRCLASFHNTSRQMSTSKS